MSRARKERVSSPTHPEEEDYLAAHERLIAAWFGFYGDRQREAVATLASKRGQQRDRKPDVAASAA